jgi:hydrogenase-4 component E
MKTTEYVTVLDISVGALMLCAVLLVWRRALPALVRLLSVQGLALALIPITLAVHRHDGRLLAVGFAVLVLRAAVLPAVVGKVLRGEPHPREASPLVNTTASLLAVAVLTVLAYAVSRPIVVLDPTPATQASPLAIAVVLTAVFMLVTRRRALSQVVGFLMLDNGIAALAFLTTAGVPLIVEFGASLDILLAVLVLQILSGRMRVKFGGTDLDELRELRD